MLALSDDAYKLIGAIVGALTIALTIVLNWKKEEKRDEVERDTAKASLPGIMQALAAGGASMPALQVDLLNDIHRAAERLTSTIERQIAIGERQAEETRRAAMVTEKQADETRRLGDKMQDVVEALQREQRHR